MTKSNKTNQPQPGPDLVFQPHPLARHRHFQTIYSSLVPIKGITLRRTAQEMVLEPGQGVRLRGFYSPQPPGESKGLEHTFATAGSVLIGCHEPGHYAGGMVATVAVD